MRADCAPTAMAPAMCAGFNAGSQLAAIEQVERAQTVIDLAGRGHIGHDPAQFGIAEERVRRFVDDDDDQRQAALRQQLRGGVGRVTGAGHDAPHAFAHFGADPWLLVNGARDGGTGHSGEGGDFFEREFGHGSTLLGRLRERSRTGVSFHCMGLAGRRHGEKREEGGRFSEKET